MCVCVCVWNLEYFSARSKIILLVFRVVQCSKSWSSSLFWEQKSSSMSETKHLGIPYREGWYFLIKLDSFYFPQNIFNEVIVLLMVMVSAVRRTILCVCVCGSPVTVRILQFFPPNMQSVGRGFKVDSLRHNVDSVTDTTLRFIEERVSQTHGSYPRLKRYE